MEGIELVGPKDLFKVCKPTFEYLHERGVSKVDCLKMITTNAAKVMDLDAEIGVISRLKKADIILCKGIPVFDFTDTDSVVMVIKDGVIEIDKN